MYYLKNEIMVVSVCTVTGISVYLITNDLQFGLLKGCSTSVCTVLVTETFAHYANSESPIYFALLNAKKAFDRVKDA
jgi:hypothetical protein